MKNKFWEHKADLQSAITSRNGAGQEIKEWQPVRQNIECYIRGLSGAEIVAASRTGYKINAKMYCDKSIPAVKTDRIVSDGRIYEIEYVNGQIGPHLQIDLRSLE